MVEMNRVVSIFDGGAFGDCIGLGCSLMSVLSPQDNPVQYAELMGDILICNDATKIDLWYLIC